MKQAPHEKPKKGRSLRKVEAIHERELRPAREMIEALDSRDLAELLCDVFDRRRLDGEGNPREMPGLYIALTTALIALLAEDELSEEDRRLAEKLAYVGRGGKVLTKDQETVNLIVEIHDLVEGVLKSRNWTGNTDRASAIATTIEQWTGRKVDTTWVVEALSIKNLLRATTEVVGAAGIIEFPRGDSDAWRTPYKRVKNALAAARENQP